MQYCNELFLFFEIFIGTFFLNDLLGVGDSEDYEALGSETETEHGGVSSRTESSNHLDDMSTLRDHGLIYARAPPQDLKSGCDLVYGIKPKTLQRDHRPAKEKLPKEDMALQQRIHHSEYSNGHAISELFVPFILKHLV